MFQAPARSAMALSALSAALLVSACAGRDRLDRAADMPADTRCLEAVAGTTGDADVSLLSTEPTETGTRVLVGVEGVEAPWLCEIGEGGRTVVRLEYTGTSGTL
jgi:hypothetical protein